jgi:hypothetical protein
MSSSDFSISFPRPRQDPDFSISLSRPDDAYLAQAQKELSEVFYAAIASDLASDDPLVPYSKTRFARPYTRQERARFFLIDSVESWQKECRSRSERRVKFLDVAAKIIRVFMAILSVFMCLAIFNFPAWVPWGLTLPAIFVLSIVSAKLGEKAEVAKRDMEFAPLLEEFLKTHSFKTLHPIGEWDLPEVDERLKSDLLMKEELQKRHPRSGKKIEDLAQRLDLDLTPYLRQSVACRLAGITKTEEKWIKVTKALRESRGHLRKEDLQKWEKAGQETFGTAYQGLSPLDFSPPTIKEHVEAVVRMYGTFSQVIFKVQQLAEEGEALYGAPYAFPDKKGQLYASWQKYLEDAISIKEQIDPLVELLKNETTADFSSAFTIMEEDALRLSLFKLIDNTRQIEANLKGWIAAHPQKRLAAFEEKIAAFEKKFNEIKADIKLAPKMGEALRTAKQKLVALKSGLTESAGNDASRTQALDAFNKEVMAPLSLCMNLRGESSKVKIWFQAFFNKLPAAPFVRETLPKEDGPVRMRKVEEIRLNAMLQKIDAKMLRTNLIRVGLLRMPLYLLFAIEAIFAIYFSIPWFFWIGCAFAVASEGISYYIDYRLRQANRQKQAVKLQHVLLNHPDIGAIPGTLPRLAQLRQLQREYGLEGIRPTWARTLAEGEEVLPKAQDLESAKKALSKLAKEGSKEAATYLEKHLILLRSKYRLEQQKRPDSERAKALKVLIEEVTGPPKTLKALIEEIERSRAKPGSLSGDLSKEKWAKLSDYDKSYAKYAGERNEVDAELNEIIEEKMTLEKRQAEYERVSKLFERLTQEMERAGKPLPRAEHTLQLYQRDAEYGSKEAIDAKTEANSAKLAQLEISRKKLKDRYDDLRQQFLLKKS